MGADLRHTNGALVMGKRSTSVQYFRAGKVVGRRTPKYRNKKCEYRGIKFDSLKERDRYIELRLLEQAGVISELACQMKIPLRCGNVDVRSKTGRRLSYWVDFTYIENSERKFEDVKGMDTPLSSLKIAMVEAEYGYTIRIIR